MALKSGRNRYFIIIMFVTGLRNCQLYFCTGNFYFEVFFRESTFIAFVFNYRFTSQASASLTSVLICACLPIAEDAHISDVGM